MQGDTGILRKDHFEDFLKTLFKDRLVFAPVRRGELLLFERVESASDIAMTPGNTKNPAKVALFPQKERLFAYFHREGSVEIERPPEGEQDQVLFAIRPCDARAFLLLDSVFGGDTPDPYYADKRSRTVIVSIACPRPTHACFCLSLGGGPCSPEGSDLLLVDLGDRYIVQAGSEKGRALLENPYFEDADEEAFEKATKLRKEAESSMDRAATREASEAKQLERQLEHLFDDAIWHDLAESCLGCGICTYLCPTCHCFDMCDETTGDAGERLRIWDSCQFPLFTRQASGFNPRRSQKERFRHRIMHKFCYLPQKGNGTGCVGCGRCVAECPVNLDIREVLGKLSKEGAT